MSEAVEFGDKSDADRFREEYPNFRCPVDDDRRFRTVHFTSDTPTEVLDEARTVAEAGFADREARDAKPGNRELTESEKRGLDFSRDGVSYMKAKALANVAEEYGVNAFEHVDVAEVDSADDARPIFERARRSGGTGRGGGTAQYDDEAAEREERERRQRGERQAAERCDHARGKCRAGEPEACEFLQETCGLSEDEAERLLDERERAGADAAERDGDGDPWIPPEKWDDLTGQEKGSVSNAAGGYHGAVSDLKRAVADARDAFKQAQSAAKALNSLRAGVGEGPVHFTTLEEANAALADLSRMAAADCHECHADHGDHDHDVTDGEREDLRAFIEGAGSTPVGTSGNAGTPREAAEHSGAVLADREPERADSAQPAPPERIALDVEPAGEPPSNSTDTETTAEVSRDALQEAAESIHGSDTETQKKAAFMNVLESWASEYPEGAVAEAADDLAFLTFGRPGPVNVRRAVDSAIANAEQSGDSAESFDRTDVDAEPSVQLEPSRPVTHMVDGDDLTPVVDALRTVAEKYTAWRVTHTPEDTDADSRRVARGYYTNSVDGDMGTGTFVGSIEVKTNDAGSRTYQADVVLNRGRNVGGNSIGGRAVYDDTIHNGTPEEVADHIKEFVEHAAGTRDGKPFFIPRVSMDAAAGQMRQFDAPEETSAYGDRIKRNAGPDVPELSEGDRVVVDARGGTVAGTVGFRHHDDQIPIQRRGANDARVTLMSTVPQAFILTADGTDSLGAVSDIRLVDGVDRTEVRRDTDVRLLDGDGAEPDDGGEQFAAERQNTLGGETADTEDKQFTLTGDDASDSAAKATPGAWTPLGDKWLGGPYTVRVERSGGYGSDSFAVMLRSDDGKSEQVAGGVPTQENAVDVASEFTDRVAPDEVSFHSADSAVPEAAAGAKSAVTFDRQDGQGGLSDFGDR